VGFPWFSRRIREGGTLSDSGSELGQSAPEVRGGWQDEPGMEHLRDDAPFRVCDGCGAGRGVRRGVSLAGCRSLTGRSVLGVSGLSRRSARWLDWSLRVSPVLWASATATPQTVLSDAAV